MRVGSDTSGKRCPSCGSPVPAGGRGLGRVFCSPKCRVALHAVHRIQGFQLAALVKAVRATCGAKAGTREAAIGRFAKDQIRQLATAYLDADRQAGRDAVGYVGSLMDSGSVAVQRARNRRTRS